MKEARLSTAAQFTSTQGGAAFCVYFSPNCPQINISKKTESRENVILFSEGHDDEFQKGEFFGWHGGAG